MNTVTFYLIPATLLIAFFAIRERSISNGIFHLIFSYLPAAVACFLLKESDAISIKQLFYFYVPLTVLYLLFFKWVSPNEGGFIFHSTQNGTNVTYNRKDKINSLYVIACYDGELIQFDYTTHYANTEVRMVCSCSIRPLANLPSNLAEQWSLIEDDWIDLIADDLDTFGAEPDQPEGKSYSNLRQSLVWHLNKKLAPLGAELEFFSVAKLERVALPSS